MTRAIEERDAQRAAVEQKAQEVEPLNAALRQKDEALEARAAQCEQLEKTLEAQAVSLTEKVALAEGQREAILCAETALQAARAEIDQGRKCVEGTYEDLVQFTWLCRGSSFVCVWSCGRGWRTRLW